jgi:hypothetical protein
MTTCRTCGTRDRVVALPAPAPIQSNEPNPPNEPTGSDQPSPSARGDEAERLPAALLLRVWPEGDELRCRLLGFPDLSARPGVVAVAHGIDAICDAVRRWLHEL